MKVVNDLKRKISARKRFTECTYEDFKQEDKLELLVKVLSNEEILEYLYQKIFNKAPTRLEYELDNEGSKQLRTGVLGQSEKAVGRLPLINSFRRWYDWKDVWMDHIYNLNHSFELYTPLSIQKTT